MEIQSNNFWVNINHLRTPEGQQKPSLNGRQVNSFSELSNLEDICLDRYGLAFKNYHNSIYGSRAQQQWARENQFMTYENFETLWTHFSGLLKPYEKDIPDAKEMYQLMLGILSNKELKKSYQELVYSFVGMAMFAQKHDIGPEEAGSPPTIGNPGFQSQASHPSSTTPPENPTTHPSSGSEDIPTAVAKSEIVGSTMQFSMHAGISPVLTVLLALIGTIHQNKEEEQFQAAKLAMRNKMSSIMLDLFRNISHYTHELSQKQLKNKSKDAANIEILIDVDKLPQYTNMSLFTLTHDDGMHHTHLERDEGESKKAGKDVVKMNSQALTSQSDIAKQVSQHLQNLVTQDTNAYKSKDSEINTLFQICSSVLGTVLQANKKLSDNL